MVNTGDQALRCGLDTAYTQCLLCPVERCVTVVFCEGGVEGRFEWLHKVVPRCSGVRGFVELIQHQDLGQPFKHQEWMCQDTSWPLLAASRAFSMAGYCLCFISTGATSHTSVAPFVPEEPKGRYKQDLTYRSSAEKAAASGMEHSTYAATRHNGLARKRRGTLYTLETSWGAQGAGMSSPRVDFCQDAGLNAPPCS